MIKNCIKELKVNTNKIVVLGISEGFQVGAKLLDVNSSITHAVLMVGNGLNQFYDFIIQNRVDAEKGKISLSEAQKNIDSLQIVFKDIYENPTSTKKYWLGHTYLRWASFCEEIPAQHILESKIPILIISCSNDKNTTVLSTDYIALEAIKLNKTNIEQKVYPYDHSFTELILDEEGKLIDKKRHMKEVMKSVTEWINS